MPPGQLPPHAGWLLLMHGVVPAGTQPQVASSVLSSIRSVVQTSPVGHAPPQVAWPGASPPVSAHAVATAGKHTQFCVPGATAFAQQVSPVGHDPPQPG